MDYIFLLIKIQNAPGMISKQATRSIIHTLFTAPRFFTTVPIHAFSKLSQSLRSASYRNKSFRGSNIRFRSNDLSLLTYCSHPSIETNNTATAKFYEIKDSPVLTLNFLADTTEELVEFAWENRKSISLRFRDALKLMKIEPMSNETITIEQLTYSEQAPGKAYKKRLRVTDHSAKGEMQIVLRQTAQNEITKDEDNLWELRFDIKYDDYATFAHSIRVQSSDIQSNMLYISGTKFSLEITKEESLIELDDYVPRFQPQESFSFSKSKETKKSPSKSAKPKKEKL